MEQRRASCGGGVGRGGGAAERGGGCRARRSQSRRGAAGGAPPSSPSLLLSPLPPLLLPLTGQAETSVHSRPPPPRRHLRLPRASAAGMHPPPPPPLRGLGLRLGPLPRGLPRRDLRPELRPVSLGCEPPAQPQLLLVFVEFAGRAPEAGAGGCGGSGGQEGRCRRGCRRQPRGPRAPPLPAVRLLLRLLLLLLPTAGPWRPRRRPLGCGPGARGAPRSGHFRLLRKGKRLFWLFPVSSSASKKEKKKDQEKRVKRTDSPSIFFFFQTSSARTFPSRSSNFNSSFNGRLLPPRARHVPRARLRLAVHAADCAEDQGEGRVLDAAPGGRGDGAGIEKEGRTSIDCFDGRECRRRLVSAPFISEARSCFLSSSARRSERA